MCAVQDDSWSDVDYWVRELNYYLPRELDDGMPVLFVGNKRDLVDKKDEEQKLVSFRQVSGLLTVCVMTAVDRCIRYRRWLMPMAFCLQ